MIFNDNQWYLKKSVGEIISHEIDEVITSNTAISSDASKNSTSVTGLSIYFERTTFDKVDQETQNENENKSLPVDWQW